MNKEKVIETIKANMFQTTCAEHEPTETVIHHIWCKKCGKPLDIYPAYAPIGRVNVVSQDDMNAILQKILNAVEETQSNDKLEGETLREFVLHLEKNDGGYGESPDYEYQLEQYLAERKDELQRTI